MLAARGSSVSSLYSDDEVELLLDEIRELEPASCRAEDIQDFEIAGSLCARPSSRQSLRSPAATERSWDSHAVYRRGRPGDKDPVAALYWRPRLLLSPAGGLRLVLALVALAACACVWRLVGVRSWLLPLGARVRALLLAALCSWLVHAALLCLRVTRLEELLPLPWARVGAAAGTGSAATLGVGGALVLHAVVAAPEYADAAESVRRWLLAASGLALIGAALATALAVCECACEGDRCPLRERRPYRAVPAIDTS